MADPIKCFYLDHSLDTHVAVNSDTGFGPCCYEHFPGVKSFRDLHQHPSWIQIKTNFDQGQWPDSFCSICKNVEQNKKSVHIQSKRESSLHQFNYVQNELDSLENHQLYSLVIDTGSLCNFQCRTCGPWLSSSWISEFNNLPGKIRPWSSRVDFKVWPHVSYDLDLDDIEKVKFVNFIGGEPFYNIEAYGMMEKIFKATGGDCEIGFSTNGSITLDLEKYPYLSQFRRLNVSFSIDAVGKAFEFIRTGGNWKRVQENIARIKSLPNVGTIMHPTFSVLNLFEIPSLKALTQELDLKWSTETTYVHSPEYLSYAVLNDEEKQIVYQWLNDRGYGYFCDIFLEFPFDREQRNKFLEFMDHTKIYHNMDWQDYLPNLYNLMKKDRP